MESLIVSIKSGSHNLFTGLFGRNISPRYMLDAASLDSYFVIWSDLKHVRNRLEMVGSFC